MPWRPAWTAMLAGLCVAAVAYPSAAQQQNPLLFDPSDMRYRPDGGATVPPASAGRRDAAPQVRMVKPVPAESVGAGVDFDRARPVAKGPAESPGLGRVPVENFSFGLETSTKLKPDKLPDGSPVPGMQSRPAAGRSALPRPVGEGADQLTLAAAQR